MYTSFKEMSKQVQSIIEVQKIMTQNGLTIKKLPYDYVLSKLDKEYQRILYSDYVDQLDQYWYEKYYSRATYYRYKKCALIEFLTHYESV